MVYLHRSIIMNWHSFVVWSFDRLHKSQHTNIPITILLLTFAFKFYIVFDMFPLYGDVVIFRARIVNKCSSVVETQIKLSCRLAVAISRMSKNACVHVFCWLLFFNFVFAFRFVFLASCLYFCQRYFIFGAFYLYITFFCNQSWNGIVDCHECLEIIYRLHRITVDIFVDFLNRDPSDWRRYKEKTIQSEKENWTINLK